VQDQDKGKETKKPGLLAIIGSIISAAFGVQSSANRERDFKHGKFRNYVISAIIFVGLFIATIFTIVKIVLS
jgi:hypothetical protein